MALTLEPDLRRAPAPAAAGARAARHARSPSACLALVGRLADDGLDRRAAGAGGPRGGLRDPVPVARGRRRSRRRGGGDARPLDRARRRGGAPTIATAARGERRRDARCCCSRPCRWCAASACCWWSGVAMALLLRADRRLRGARAARARRAAASARARRGARPTAPAARPRWRGARELLRENPLTRAAPQGRRSAARCAAPGGCSRAGLALAALGLGARHADERADRHHQARAAEPRLAAQPPRARARHGVGGEIDLIVYGRRTSRARRRSNG